MTIPTLDQVHYRTVQPQPRPGRDDPPTPCSLAPDAWADPDREAEAIAGCRACSILRRCHAWALGLSQAQEVGGVVAGMTARTRAAIRNSERAKRRRRKGDAGE